MHDFKIKRVIFLILAAAIIAAACGQRQLKPADGSSQIEGRWKNSEDTDCKLLLDIIKSGDEFSYRFHANNRLYEGKVTVYPDGIELEGIPWISNLGDTIMFPNAEETPAFGIDFVWEDGKFVMQNYGNAMNFYIKLDCSAKYITLIKE